MDARPPSKPLRPISGAAPFTARTPRAVPLPFDRLSREDLAPAEPLAAWGQDVAAFVRVYFGDGQDAGAASRGALAVAVSGQRRGASNSGSGRAGPSIKGAHGTDPETFSDGAQVPPLPSPKYTPTPHLTLT